MGYFEDFEIIEGELQQRFAQENFSFATHKDELSLNSVNGKAINLLERKKSIHSNYLDTDKLIVQLCMLSGVVKTTLLDGITIEQVTRIQTLCQVFNNQPSMKILLSEIHNLLRIYLTNSVTTSTAECSFICVTKNKNLLEDFLESSSTKLLHAFAHFK